MSQQKRAGWASPIAPADDHPRVGRDALHEEAAEMVQSRRLHAKLQLLERVVRVS
jgi:hypothetical protein